MFQVNYYTLPDGRQPVRVFIDSLSVKQRARVLERILLLEERGNLVGEPISRPVKDGIYELRIKTGTTQIRILYFFQKGKIILLSNGFIKKTKKTPAGELRLAVERKQEYERRQAHE